MMDFKINLIKNKVPSLEKRRFIFAGIILYLFVCGFVLVSLSYRITANFVKIDKDKEAVALLEKKIYTQNFPGKNLYADASKMKTKISQYVEALERINNVLAKRIDLTTLFLRFSAALPIGAHIDNFKLDNLNKVLSFYVVAPEDKMRGTFDTSKLISYWKNDTYLMSQIEHIQSSISRKQKRKEEQISISEFSCSLAKEGKP